MSAETIVYLSLASLGLFGLAYVLLTTKVETLTPEQAAEAFKQFGDVQASPPDIEGR